MGYSVVLKTRGRVVRLGRSRASSLDSDATRTRIDARVSPGVSTPTRTSGHILYCSASSTLVPAALNRRWLSLPCVVPRPVSSKSCWPRRKPQNSFQYVLGRLFAASTCLIIYNTPRHTVMNIFITFRVFPVLKELLPVPIALLPIHSVMTVLDGVNGTVCNAQQYPQSLRSYGSPSPSISCLTHGETICFVVSI